MLKAKIQPSLLISACLLGIRCRYDGEEKLLPALEELLQYFRPIPVCPEQLGGLPTPRAPAFFIGGDGWEALNERAQIVSSDGVDVSEAFLQGAAMTLKIARICKSELALFKDESPSCGINEVTISNKIIPGMGVTAALLKKEGFMLYSDQHWQDLITDHLRERFIGKKSRIKKNI